MKNYKLYDVDYFGNFKELIYAAGAKYAALPAVTCYSYEGECLTRTYGETAEDVKALTEAFLSRGLGGKNIAVLGESNYCYLISIIAAACAGGAAIPVDVDQPADYIASMVKYADAECVVISESVSDILTQSPLLSAMNKIIISETGGKNTLAEYIEYGKSLLASGSRAWEELKIKNDDTAVIVYTSGTTSTAKPVMLSHYAIMQNACYCNAVVEFNRRVFTSLPLYHSYGLTCTVINNLARGAHVCINGDIKHMARDLELFEPQTVMTVPLIVDVFLRKLTAETERIIEEKTKEGESSPFRKIFGKGKISYNPDLKSVKEKVFPGLTIIGCGGAHLADSLSRTLERYGIQVIHGYGITENSPLISVNRNQYNNPASVGVVLPCNEIKIEDGEILVRGICLMKGYYKNEEQTREAFTDGWFHTGDMGFLDSNGFLFITGRKKNLLVLKNGKKVSPEELEGCLADIPIIKEVMAYGSTIGADADNVIPAVMIYPDPTLTAGMSSYDILEVLQREINTVNEKLPSYKQIKIINIRDTEFPKTAKKTIKRTPQRV